MENIGGKIKELRKSMNITREVLARRLEVDVNVIDELELDIEPSQVVAEKLNWVFPGLIDENIVSAEDYYFSTCFEILEDRLKEPGLICHDHIIPMVENIKRWGMPEYTIPVYRAKAAFNEIMEVMVEQGKAIRKVNGQYIIER